MVLHDPHNISFLRVPVLNHLLHIIDRTCSYRVIKSRRVHMIRNRFPSNLDYADP